MRACVIYICIRRKASLYAGGALSVFSLKYRDLFAFQLPHALYSSWMRNSARNAMAFESHS